MSYSGRATRVAKYLLALGLSLPAIGVLAWMFGIFMRFGRSCDERSAAFPLAALVAAVLGVSAAYVAGRRLLFLHRGKLLLLSVLIGVVVAVPVAAIAPQDGAGPRPDADISGRVASLENGDRCADFSEGHTVSLQRGESIRLSFDSGLYWSIALPDGNTTVGSSSNLSQLATVEQTEGGDILYTATQSGEHRISFSPEVYVSGSYYIYLDVNDPRSPPVPTRTPRASPPAPSTPTGR